jgi:holo-[acyl-carrier protein] synthase
MQLTNGAAAQLARMVPAGKTAVVHLTMTDEYPYAQAYVIIEAI